MKLNILNLFFLQIFFSLALSAQPSIVIEPYLSGLNRPVKITHAHDSRLFVAEIGGKIRIVKNGSILSTPFLDIGSKINDPDWAGIYSIVFHPNYQSNGYFYVMYVVKSKFEVQISRFSRSGNASSDVASATETPILTIPYTDILGGHRGGDMAFGKDNQLYISTGDNGPGSRGVIGDPDNNSQNMSKLFGKLLKIDPDNPPTAAKATQNIWALGLRNPWRFSFDRSTGDLWIGDNGQDGWEEINFLSASNTSTPRNFGWDYMEGNAVYRNCGCNIANTFIAPKLTYPGYTNNGNTSASVMGGFVYRGLNYPSLKGSYFYGDYQSFNIGVIVPNGYQGFIPNVSYSSLISFGEDQQGELYVASFFNGTIGKLTLPNDPLPVKLEFFVAKTSESGILLEWKTVIETNFANFELEHSDDGLKFKKVISLPSSGTNNLYSYTDERSSDRLIYYRLKMIDQDGSYQISRMIFVKSSQSAEFTAFPNPASGKFTIKGGRPGEMLNIHNSLGDLLFSQKITSETSEEINLKNRPAGVYHLSVEDKGTGFVRKLKLVKE